MDTRKKIISAAEVAGVLAEGEWVVVIGRFDPMTAFEVERLAELGESRRLLAVVLEEDGTLLTASSRAALVAALREVRAVTIGRPMIPQNAAVRILEDSEGEAVRRSAFIELVRSRQRIE